MALDATLTCAPLTALGWQTSVSSEQLQVWVPMVPARGPTLQLPYSVGVSGAGVDYDDTGPCNENCKLLVLSILFCLFVVGLEKIVLGVFCKPCFHSGPFGDA